MEDDGYVNPSRESSINEYLLQHCSSSETSYFVNMKGIIWMDLTWRSILYTTYRKNSLEQYGILQFDLSLLGFGVCWSFAFNLSYSIPYFFQIGLDPVLDPRYMCPLDYIKNSISFTPITLCIVISSPVTSLWISLGNTSNSVILVAVNEFWGIPIRIAVPLQLQVASIGTNIHILSLQCPCVIDGRYTLGFRH